MNMKRLIYAFICVLLAGSFAITAVKAATQTKRNQKLQNIQIQSKDIEATKLEVDLRRLNIELKKTLEDKNLNESKVQNLEKQIQDAQEREKALQSQLQAKAKAKADAIAKAAQAQSVALASTKASASSGSCAEWMAAAGIPITTATTKLILKESSCNPKARNKSSGACGIPQAYPCAKLPCSLNEAGAVCQLEWMSQYVQNRYGSWDNALSTWYSRCGSPQGCWY